MLTSVHPKFLALAISLHKLSWWVVSTHLKNIRQNGNLPQNRGENKAIFENHHPVSHIISLGIMLKKKQPCHFFPKGREKLLKIVGKGVIPAGIGILMAWVCKNPCFFPLIFPSLPLENHVWSLKVSASTTTTTLSFLRRRCLFVSKGGGSEVQSGGLNI